MRKILSPFSYLFHPIFTPVLGTIIYLKCSDNYFAAEQQYLILIQVSIIMIFIPLCFFFLLKTLGKADSIMLSDASQRKIPLLIQAVLIGILIRESFTSDIVPELHYYFLGGLISALAALLLLFVPVKASLHMMGMGALAFFIIGLSLRHQVNLLYVIAFVVLMTGLVAASRLEMQAHDGTELLMGLLAGSMPQLILWHLWL